MGKARLKRMAERMCKRAGIKDEQGVTVSFGFRSFLACIFLSLIEELPFGLGVLGTLVFFHWHRIVLVTDQNTYVFKGKMFHRPGKLLGTYPHGPTAFTRDGAKLDFPDGVHVYHLPLFAIRVKLVAQAAGVE
jgi:hypothetical protein